MKPRIFIAIDTYAIGGPGKGIIQFLKNGGLDWVEPVLAGFWRGSEGRWQFRDAVQDLGVKFLVLRQRSAFDPFVIFEALRLIKENRIVILQSHGYKAHIVCLVLKWITKLPWVAFVHGWTSENAKVKFYNYIDKTIVRFADKIVPVSENLRKRLNLENIAGHKIVTIPNAIDSVDGTRIFVEQRKQYKICDDEILVGVIGRLSPEKGHIYFVEAFKVVCEKYPKLKAMFVGEGQEREAIECAIRNCGLSDRIILVGYQEDMASFYHALDVVVLPSLAEGMPNVALEAMVYAKPVIATDVGGIPEVVIDGETGYLVESQDSAALSAALEKLLNDQQRMKELGLAGKRRVETEFNPHERAKKILQVYGSLSNGLNFSNPRGS